MVSKGKELPFLEQENGFIGSKDGELKDQELKILKKKKNRRTIF